MKFSLATALLVSLAAETTVASSWFSKAAYNKWHETELEAWLSDHDIPYPAASDRKELENKVKANWQTAVESPYASWDTPQLNKYLSDRGQDIKKGTEKNKDSLISQVKSTWAQTEGSASNAYSDVSAWIFDSWSESSLKAFADKNSIPVPQPRKRDSLLKTVRENYQSVANKLGQSSLYPGNWLYESWSDSELKAWLDERGIPAPQTGKRDKLISSVRRNAYLASKEANSYAASASKAAAGAQQTLSDKIFDAWSESEIKEWADKNNIKVPQGSNRNELLAIARKNAAKLTGDNITNSLGKAYGSATASAASVYGAATSKVGPSASSAASVASASASSASSVASVSAASAASVASASASSLSKYGAASASSLSKSAASTGNAIYAQATSAVYHYYTEAQIALGLQTNYLSSASKSAASAYKTASAKLEL